MCCASHLDLEEIQTKIDEYKQSLDELTKEQEQIESRKERYTGFIIVVCKTPSDAVKVLNN